MINKFKTFEIENASQVLGGQTTLEMARETALNRTKSASKIHNKHVQVIMA